MTTVLVCDDLQAEREGLRRALNSLMAVERVITASSGEEAIVRWDCDAPDVVLMDVRMPGIGGVEAARRIVSTDPGAVVVMLASGTDSDAVGSAVELGARGYLPKDASPEELSAVLQLVLDDAVAEPTRKTAERRRVRLSDREQQVLEGMSRGLTNAEIGRELFLSEDTVKTHARRLFRKLDVPDRAAAVAFGFRSGLLT